MVCLDRMPLEDRSRSGVFMIPGLPGILAPGYLAQHRKELDGGTQPMKRMLFILAIAVALTGQTAPAHAQTQTWFGFQVGVSGGNAPPPVIFRSEPRYIVVDDVQVVDDDRCDDDVFRANNSWWRLRGGYWYRAASWRGPWMSIDVRRVPERVLVVPARHWKHHPRHGREGRDGRTVIVVRDRDGDRHGRRHGKGHGHDRDDD